ncbi:hypothetical protein LPJ73_005646 [Coemansia sp. RSA 2703]|nr:hypothetical protein LPJ73_005646 [Coemansia sp. RSA 2703]
MATRAFGRAVVVKDPDPKNMCMCKPSLLYSILDATPLSVIARVRTGHFVEAQVMELAGANFIDESEKLETNPYGFHIDMDKEIINPGIMYVSTVLDVARAVSLGASAIRLIGASSPTDLIKKKNKLYTDMAKGLKLLEEEKSGQRDGRPAPVGNPFMMRGGLGPGGPQNEIEQILGAKDSEYREAAIKLCQSGRIPLPMFACDVVATPLDAALLMDEGFSGVIVSNDVFTNNLNPIRYANAFVQAVHNYKKPHVLTRIAAEMGRGAYGAAGGGSSMGGGVGGMRGPMMGGPGGYRPPPVLFNGTQEQKAAAVAQMTPQQKIAAAKAKMAMSKNIVAN